MSETENDEKHIMMIEGCNPALGCTIVLSGPDEKIAELKKLKQCMKRILPLVKNLILERYYLQLINIEVPHVPAIDQKYTGD